MKTFLLLIASALVAAGCSTSPSTSATTTASSFAPESVLGTWEFTITGDGSAHKPVFRLTDDPAETCLSGDWFRAKVVSADDLNLSDPAYTYSSGRLELLLVNGLCDSYRSLIGTVSDAQFSGEHVSYGLYGSTEHGKVTGFWHP